ncbi:MAG: hypothetical protein KIS66_13690 [Fimbriimonadaceae bacterium]|nr:hypothetical protein [Fimbriimonadaceae bacterium]
MRADDTVRLSALELAILARRVAPESPLEWLRRGWRGCRASGNESGARAYAEASEIAALRGEGEE